MPFINRIGSGATRKFGFGAGMAPGAPTSVIGTRGDTQVSVAFTEPSALGTGTPTYTATSSPGSFTASGSSSPLVVAGLTNGTSYTFTVTASNAFGSATSSPSSAVTPAGVPATPSAPTPTAGNGQVSLSWTAPSNNGSAITDYLVYYSTSSGGSYTLFSDGTSTGTTATVTGLSNGTAYYFKIRAVNDVGNSDYSSASTASTPVAPPYFPPCFATCTPPCGAATFTGATVCAGSVRVCDIPGCIGSCVRWALDCYSYSQQSCVDACGVTRYATCASFCVDSTVSSQCCP